MSAATDRGERSVMEDQADVVLIVEDDRATLDAVVEVLMDEGFEVRLASNGQEALTMLATLRPRLILLDWMMPQMSGREVLAALRADRSLATIPVVLFSAAPQSDLLGAGVRILQKPISVEMLLRVIHEECRR